MADELAMPFGASEDPGEVEDGSSESDWWLTMPGNDGGRAPPDDPRLIEIVVEFNVMRWVTDPSNVVPSENTNCAC